MRKNLSIAMIALLVSFMAVTSSQAAEWGLKKVAVKLQSAGPLTFGPDHILFVADPKAATVYAIATGDGDGDAAKVTLNIEGLTSKVAAAIGSEKATIADVTVNPANGTVYLSVAGSSGAAICRIDPAGKISKLDLSSVESAKVEIPNAPKDEITGSGRRRGNKRLQSITYLAYSESRLYVSGLSTLNGPSSIREIAFPFVGQVADANLEIYHGAHGKVENYSAPRVFVPFNVDGKPNLLAGYVCTPLVRFPVAEIKSSKKVVGTTVAELGNRNRPLDMIVYKKGGETFLLMANSARGVMKISTKDIGRAKGITSRVSGGGVAGQKYDTIKDFTGVEQLAKLNDTHALIVTDEGKTLRTVALP